VRVKVYYESKKRELKVVYYESIKRDLKRLETRLIDEKFAIVMGKCVI
jgi:ASC-1-like (ASCH) protein